MVYSDTQVEDLEQAEFEAAAGEPEFSAWEEAYSELTHSIRHASKYEAEAAAFKLQKEITRAILEAYRRGLEDDLSDLPF